ncbi:hypothetical protein GLU01_01510 [Nanohaloarchaea archaeon]|jgi:hypothetical protein|nr:hypothetical protein [Candidatus Nanohaloarchaea archaeon]
MRRNLAITIDTDLNENPTVINVAGESTDITIDTQDESICISIDVGVERITIDTNGNEAVSDEPEDNLQVLIEQLEVPEETDNLDELESLLPEDPEEIPDVGTDDEVEAEAEDLAAEIGDIDEEDV